MNMYRFIVILLAIAMSGCVHPDGANVRTDHEPAESESRGSADSISALVKYERDADITAKELSWMVHQKDNIKASLIDPDSAKFRNVLISRVKGAPAVLGEVNSKNGFGGYSGFRRFFAAEHIQAIEGENISSFEFNKLWKEFVP